jgi:hypothetical protein
MYMRESDGVIPERERSIAAESNPILKKAVHQFHIKGDIH